MQKGIKRFYSWLRGPGKIKTKENEGRRITGRHNIQDEMTIKALRRQIKLLENDLDKLSKAYFVEESMNDRIAELREQVSELKIENIKVRNYIKFYSMSLYEAIYERGI